MKQRTLGRTNLKVSEIGFGAWALGEFVGASTVRAISVRLGMRTEALFTLAVMVMAFGTVLLLAGYAYAHLLCRYLPKASQVAAHVVMLGLALLLLVRRRR